MNQPSSPASHDPLLAALLARITRIRRDADSQQITRAYEAAAYWHEGQNRRSGDPYITHPGAVAEILADVGEIDQTLCAALLHDVVADTTPCTLAAIREEFGGEIAGLVGAVMALDAAPAGLTAAGSDGMAAVAAPGDRRALVIKVADRLHNIRTLRHLPHARQLRKSQQDLREPGLRWPPPRRPGTARRRTPGGSYAGPCPPRAGPHLADCDSAQD